MKNSSRCEHLKVELEESKPCFFGGSRSLFFIIQKESHIFHPYLKPCFRFIRNFYYHSYPKQDSNLGPKRKYSLLEFEISISQTTQPPWLDNLNCSFFHLNIFHFNFHRLAIFHLNISLSSLFLFGSLSGPLFGSVPFLLLFLLLSFAFVASIGIGDVIVFIVIVDERYVPIRDVRLELEGFVGALDFCAVDPDLPKNIMSLHFVWNLLSCNVCFSYPHLPTLEVQCLVSCAHNLHFKFP